MLKKKVSLTNKAQEKGRVSPCRYPVLEFLDSLAHGEACTSRGRHKFGLRIGQPGDQRARPYPLPLPLRRSHSGSSWLQAGPHSHTNIHTPRSASSHPPSFPSPCGRVHTALPGQPRARRARAPAQPLPAPPKPSRLAPALHRRTPPKAISQPPGLPPQTHPAS